MCVSTRVRLTAYNPEYGFYNGGKARQIVSDIYKVRGNFKYQPEDFKSWPSWKQFLYKAKEIQFVATAIREPRRTRAARSKYWKVCRAHGVIPPMKKLKAKPKKNPFKNAYLNIAYAARNARRPIAVEAPEPIWNFVEEGGL
jgi:hypothetical protein